MGTRAPADRRVIGCAEFIPPAMRRVSLSERGMDIWLTVVLTLHVVVAISIIFLVLLQHGKGADMGAAFGSGSSGSLFGATGSANFLSRTTAVLAAVFFLTSLGLAYLATHRPQT